MSNQSEGVVAGLPTGGPHHSDNGAAGAPLNVPLGQVPVMPKDARSLRASIFDSRKMQLAKKIVMFHGELIEVRQHTLGEAFEMADKIERMSDDEKKLFPFLYYCYVPGTDERLFGDEHIELLKALPSDENFERVTSAYRALNNLKVEEEVKN